MPVCAQTQALKTVRYTIFLDNGVVAGEQIVERLSLDTIKVHFDFKENGRGPTLDEVIKIGPDLTMLDYKVTGSAESVDMCLHFRERMTSSRLASMSYIISIRSC